MNLRGKHSISLKEKSMRILCISFHPHPSITALGGAEKRFLETSKVWLDEGIEMTVIEPEPALLRDRESAQVENLKPSVVSYDERSWPRIYLGWLLWMLTSFFKGLAISFKRKPDVILSTNNTLPSLVPAYLIHAVSRLPLCVIVHHVDIPSPETPASLLKTYHMFRQMGYTCLTSILKATALSIILFILSRSTICISVSNSTAKTLLRNRILENRIHVSGNGVDLNYAESLGFEGKKSYHGVFVGRISREKGVFSLIGAWQKVLEAMPHARLVMIGSGVDLTEVKKTIRNLGLEKNVFVLGPCRDNEMYLKIKASKVFVFPSLLEGWGLAVAEALACGLPAICYDISAIREIFGECKSVFLVPVGDVDKFASAIVHVLKMDLGELERISKDYVKDFSWNRVASRDLEIIESLSAHVTQKG